MLEGLSLRKSLKPDVAIFLYATSHRSMVYQIFISLILPDPRVIKVGVLEKGEFDQLDDLPVLAPKQTYGFFLV